MSSVPRDRLDARVGYATRPMLGETVCGDGCGVWVTRDRLVLALVDGLGHGPHAADAAQAAQRCIGECLDQSCDAIFEECDRQLRDTRGAALAIAIVEPAHQRMSFAMVGNIRTVLMTDGKERRLPGACGIVGAGYTGLISEHRPLAKGDMLVLYSDGLDEFVPLREVLCTTNAPPRQLAEIALQRWASGKDDASMLIYRHEG